MRCWNCNHKVTRKARVCGHCEADLSQAPSDEEAAAVVELLGKCLRTFLPKWAQR